MSVRVKMKKFAEGSLHSVPDVRNEMLKYLQPEELRRLNLLSKQTRKDIHQQCCKTTTRGEQCRIELTFFSTVVQANR